MSETDDRSDAGSAHTDAATAFVRRVEAAGIDGVESLILFGSTARGEARGLESDVDFLAVVAEAADTQAVGDALRDIAYDVMIDHGPVVEVHTVSASTFEKRREQPFVRNVMRDGEVYV